MEAVLALLDFALAIAWRGWTYAVIRPDPPARCLGLSPSITVGFWLPPWPPVAPARGQLRDVAVRSVAQPDSASLLDGGLRKDKTQPRPVLQHGYDLAESCRMLRQPSAVSRLCREVVSPYGFMAHPLRL